MQDAKGSRIVFGDIVDRVFWGLLVAVAAFGVAQIQDLSSGVAELNKNMATVITKLGYQDKALDNHESRIHKLESQK
jgi:hypothetical protein